MISDTLSDAVAEIQRYVKEMPEVYGDNYEILNLVQHMNTVRKHLDAIPGSLDWDSEVKAVFP